MTKAFVNKESNGYSVTVIDKDYTGKVVTYNVLKGKWVTAIFETRESAQREADIKNRM